MSVPGTSNRRRGKKAFLILGALAALAVCAWFFHGWLVRDQVSTDNAQVEADVVPVSARVGGTLARVAVGDNQKVKAGDVLMEIDKRDLDVKLRQAEADLEAAVAEAEAADAQVAVTKASSTGGLSSAQAQVAGQAASARTAQAQIEGEQASLAHARAAQVKAKGDLERAKALREAEAIPARDLEVAQAANDAARADVASAEARLTAAREQRRLADTRVTEAQGKLEQSGPVTEQMAAVTAKARLAHARAEAAQASRDQAQLQLSYATVVAPVAGTASRLAVHAGQQVAPGQPLIAVVPVETYVIANLKETQLAHIHPGQKVDVEVDALPGHTLHGKVQSVSGGTGARFSLLPPDNSTGNFVKVVQRVPVKIVLDGAPELRPGLSAEVTIHTDG